MNKEWKEVLDKIHKEAKKEGMSPQELRKEWEQALFWWQFPHYRGRRQHGAHIEHEGTGK